MSTTMKQDTDFLDEVGVKSAVEDTLDDALNGLLEKSIDWIQNNLEPLDVFSQSQLEDWATSIGFEKEDS